ncbi:ribosomal protein S18 [Lophiostoma macrostomum CBS 122681]|uniref:Small ribosomal subunit protein bS18m n=1 Tax=Lophiostoma macrostomum CBS 122681 TaxID=1314788 RepID=A0A6A6T068_9PLEO|nr:ribosomal protein S18 [Lophiostoma macrostomum CBS 122681]
MSLIRTPVWRRTSVVREGVRYVSNSRKHQSPIDSPPRAQNILDILPKSSAQSHPANATQPTTEARRVTAHDFARQNLDPQAYARQRDRSARLEDFTRQMYRKWNAGDVYAPHDLTGAEQKKWKSGKKTPQTDAFDVLGINPITEYKNYTMISEYITEMGRIKHSKDTGLRPVNQRKIAKAIRRAIGLGLMPSVHRHPLVLKKSLMSRFT